jgi:hypothetical protein
MLIRELQSVMNMSLIFPETQANNAMHLGRHQIPPVHPNESLRPGDGKRYPYEMSEALPVLHLEVSHNVSALIYDRRSNDVSIVSLIPNVRVAFQMPPRSL